MDDGPAGTIRVTGSGRGSHGPALVGGVLLAFLVVAILKPWAGLRPEGGSLPGEPVTGSVASLTPSAPSPTPAFPPDPNGMACLTDRPTQVLTLQRSTTGEVRSWVVVADGSLDPNDATVSPVLLYSRRFVGIGICRGEPDGAAAAETNVPGTTVPGSTPGPRSAIQRATIVDVRLLRGTGSDPTTVDLGAPTAITIRVDTPDAAILFGPPTAASALGRAGPLRPADLGRAVWPAGAYLFGYTLSGDQPSLVNWLRVEVLDTQGGS